MPLTTDRRATLDPVDDAALLAELAPDRGQAPRTPPEHRQGVVPARARAVEPRPRLRRGRGAGTPRPRSCATARAARSFLNILTEDNLPHYYRQINGKFGNDDVWGEWNRRWTAEEGRHAIVIRDYLAVTRSIDMRELERARMRQVSMGLVPEPRQHRRRHRLRRAAGARHPHLAPQHREAAQRPAGRGDHEPGRGRREPAPPLLPRPRVGGARDRPVGHGRRHRAPGAHATGSK